MNSLGIRTDVQNMDDVRRSLGQIAMWLERLAATTTGNGASMIGVEDAGTVFTATTVEGVLTEIEGRLAAHSI